MDARSDIFSFGVVLYELLTGKRPFAGSTQASLIAAILEREAPSVAHVAPGGLDWVIRRCLAKDPDDRWQSARDLRAELQRVAETGAAEKVPSRSAWRERAAWIAAALLLGMLAWLAPWRGLSTTAVEVMRFEVHPPNGHFFSLTSNSTIPIPQFALSPDGRALVFAATGGEKSTLWLRNFDDTSGLCCFGNCFSNFRSRIFVLEILQAIFDVSLQSRSRSQHGGAITSKHLGVNVLAGTQH